LLNCNGVVDVYDAYMSNNGDDVGEYVVEYMYGVSYVHAS